MATYTQLKNAVIKNIFWVQDISRNLEIYICSCVTDLLNLILKYLEH